MKEALQQLAEALSGSRFLRGLVVPGGARVDLTAELARGVEAALASTAEALESLMERIENNPSVTDRLDTTGVLPLADAVALGVTGVAARASGVDRDARRDHPHAAYASEPGLSVAVATETDGDVHARLDVRAIEARESIRLLRVLARERARRPHPRGGAGRAAPLGRRPRVDRVAARRRRPLAPRRRRRPRRSLPPALGELRQLARRAHRGTERDRPGLPPRQQELRALLLVHGPVTTPC